MAAFLAIVYSIGFVVLGLFALRALVVTLAYIGIRDHKDVFRPPTEWPVVTVQLPVYNERYVATRIIDAACHLRWPRDRLEIQVLDDSTDDTREVIDAAARAWRGRGVDVRVLRRDDRTGFKAGALAEGLRSARGTHVAVFDADFVPAPDFLERVVPFVGPDVAAVQTRWGHLNADHSGLTRAQALALDGHFLVEQTTRSRLGLFLNFNGTGGVWQRAAIDAAGGWQGDTLSEDVDLSYRAQLAGFRILFLPDVVVPGELPTTLLAFKRQQRRWAMGTTQVLRKLGGRIWHADRPLWVRLHALLALSGHLVHPVSLGLFLFAPLLLVYHPAFHAALGILTFIALSPPLMYAVAAAQLSRDWPRRLAVYPLLVAVTMGLSLSGTVAVFQALSGRAGTFERTPKSGEGGRQATAVYGLRVERAVVAEACLALYAWAGVFASLWWRTTGLVMFFGLFAAGFTLTTALSIRGAAPRQVRASLPHVPAGEP
jgi:cellulose synthase/poly-beta-1,6-N-acetylglucosamine synthase-like glycosyltransferase